MPQALNDLIAILEMVAGSEAAEYVYKVVDVLAPTLPTPYSEATAALVKVARDLAVDDDARKAAIATILADAQARAQSIADEFTR